MEITNQTPPPFPKTPPKTPKKRKPSDQWGYIYTGATLIAAGILWLLHNLKALPHGFEQVVFSWRFLLVVIGGFLMVTGNKKAGIITASMGVLFLLYDSLFSYIPFEKAFLPVVCIVAGTLMLSIKRR